MIFVFFIKLEVVCILILLFCSTGIISAGRMHLYLAFLFHRDYFGRLDSSPSCSFVPQGLSLADRMHLYLALLCHRDYFSRPDASLSSSFSPQGLFRLGQIRPPIAESISARPFRQLPIYLISTDTLFFLPAFPFSDYCLKHRKAQFVEYQPEES